MALHIIRGKEGEIMAVDYLKRLKFSILFCNWTYKHLEVDIIAMRDDIVHFIEVKTRHSLEFGYPEGAVTKKKFNCLKNAGVAFQNKYPFVKRIQFDILSILILKGKEVEYFFIEDVYM
jgi:putative endonuclease